MVCCPQKLVDGELYVVKNVSETSQFGCLSPCAYQLEGSHKTDEGFCFDSKFNGDLNGGCVKPEEPQGVTIIPEPQKNANMNYTNCGTLYADAYFQTNPLPVHHGYHDLIT